MHVCDDPVVACTVSLDYFRSWRVINSVEQEVGFAPPSGHLAVASRGRLRGQKPTQTYWRPTSVESETSSTCWRGTAGQFKRRPSSSTRRFCFSISLSAKARNSELLR